MTHVTICKLIGLAKEKEILELAIKQGFPSLLIGETGVGKTYLIRNIAESHGKHLVRVSLNGEVGVNELLGKWLVKSGSTYWQDGVLIDAMRHGKWILMDEINAALPEVLFCMNALLDDSKSLTLAEKDGENVTPHADFRLFASMNPPDEYAGTKEMNKALLSRFSIVISMREYSPAVELDIIKIQTGIDDYTGRIMIDVANAIRGLKRKKKIWYTCSVRDVVSWGRLLKSDGVSLGDGFVFAILNKAHIDEHKIISDCVSSATNIDVDWDKSAEDMSRLLTQDIANSIKILEEKRDNLSKILSTLEGNVSRMKLEVNK